MAILGQTLTIDLLMMPLYGEMHLEQTRYFMPVAQNVMVVTGFSCPQSWQWPVVYFRRFAFMVASSKRPAGGR